MRIYKYQSSALAGGLARRSREKTRCVFLVLLNSLQHSVWSVQQVAPFRALGISLVVTKEDITRARRYSIWPCISDGQC